MSAHHSAAAVVSLVLRNDAMPSALPATTTFTDLHLDGRRGDLGPYTANVIYKPGIGTSFCVAGLSTTRKIIAGTDGKTVTPSNSTTLAAACP